MSWEVERQFTILITSGIALTGYGLLRGILPALSLRRQFALFSGVQAIGFGVVALLSDSRGLALTSAGLGLVAATLMSGVLRPALGLTRAAAVRVPAPATVAGVLLTTASLYWFLDQQDAEVRQVNDLMEVSLAPVQLQDSDVTVLTDRGRPVVLKLPGESRSTQLLEELCEQVLRDQRLLQSVIMQEPATDESNCHGWVFTGGKYWVVGSQVDAILQDNGYHRVEQPHPGDLVVYRDGATVHHTAIVRYVTEGEPVLVEGKWGQFGVYVHEVDRCCYRSGYDYYTTSRPNHLLRAFQQTPHDTPETFSSEHHDDCPGALHLER